MRNILRSAAVAVLFASTSALAAPTNQPGWQGTITYQNSSSGPAYYSGYSRITTKVVYDPVTGTYTLKDTANPALTSTFGPSNITGSDAAFTYYSKSSGSNVETFRLLNKSGSNPLIALTYVQYGQWRRSTTSGGVTKTNDTYVVFGSKTPGSALPHTGSASYTTYLDGTFVNATGVYAVSGNGSMTANFANGSIGYSATLTGTPEAGGSNIAFGTLTGSGSIAFLSANFSGTGTTNAEGYKLNINGSFYGPAYQEIGGVFQLTTKGGNGTGAIVGHQ